MTDVPDLRPELDLLLRLADPREPGGEAGPSGVEFDWGLFLDAAFRHRVAALVGSAMARRGLIEPDSRTEYVRDALTAAAALNERRNAVLLAEAARLVQTLADKGTTVAVRKGAYLTPAVYRATHLRPMNDIDLFVDRDEAPAVADVLRGEGYQAGTVDAHGNLVPMTRRQEVFWGMHVNNLPSYQRLGDSWLPAVTVDVCFGLFLPASGCDLPAGRLLSQAVPFDLCGTTALAFRPEHMLLDVAAHLYKESTTLRYIERGKHQRLLQYVDVVSLVRAHPDLSWDTLVDEAVAAGAARNLYFALANAAALFPGSIPRPALARLADAAAVDERFLVEYGEGDTGERRSWSARDITERLFSDERPDARSQSLV
ncbi:MAG: hypothetical protein V7603_1466 [Micromonosporaceae bacterium]